MDTIIESTPVKIARWALILLVAGIANAVIWVFPTLSIGEKIAGSIVFSFSAWAIVTYFLLPDPPIPQGGPS